MTETESGMVAAAPAGGSLSVRRIAEALELRLSGLWRVGYPIPDADRAIGELEAEDAPRRLVLDGRDIAGWDSSLLAFLVKVLDAAVRRGVAVDDGGIPPGVRRLLALARAVPVHGAPSGPSREGILARIGGIAIDVAGSFLAMVEFVGEAAASLGRFATGNARFRRSDLLLLLQSCGIDALPIVSLIGFLVGLILAFIGVIQLAQFGAQIYVADLVGIAMVRVLGAVMAGIIMAGRTGAAFAAQIGTMGVNEETDALKTLGISPIDFLVLPRLLALTLMMPLLCLYADLMGILGGLFVSVFLLGMNVLEYLVETRNIISLTHLGVGVFHAAVFGVIVALAGCLRGIQCGRSSAAVGQAATSAVVTSIVGIVLATAVITAMCNALGI